MNYVKVGRTYKLSESYVSRPILIGSRYECLTIPKGFEWDGMTVPWFIRGLYNNRESDALEASCVHDYLYQTASKSRSLSDLIFYRVLRSYFYPIIKSLGAYLAVRLLGKSHYNHNGTNAK